VSWAREGSGFTLMMEALVMLLSAEMPVDAMADLIDEHDTRLWRVLMHYVEQAHAKSDWSAVRRIAVDETSARRGRRYVTNVLDDENSRLLLMVEGRGVQAIGAFAEALRRHGGDPSQIEAIAMDSEPILSSGQHRFRQVPRHGAGRQSPRGGAPPIAARGSPAQRGDVKLTRQHLESHSRASSAT
jgi:transposase